MSTANQKEGILRALQGFDRVGMRDGGLSLLNALGYSSDKRIELKPNSAARFRAEFDKEGVLNEKQAAGLVADINGATARRRRLLARQIADPKL